MRRLLRKSFQHSAQAFMMPGAEPQMHAQVVMALQGDAKFLPDLFQRLSAAKPGDAEWMNQVAFLQELCSLAKHLQAVSRTQLLSKLIGLGLFEVNKSWSGRHALMHNCLRRKAWAPMQQPSLPAAHLRCSGCNTCMLSKMRQVACSKPQ